MRAWLALGVLVVGATPAFATWSVLAVDQSSGTVVVASAACVPQRSFANIPAKGLMDIQAIVVPGRGVAAAQAAADPSRANQDAIYTGIEKGTDPRDIIDGLRSDPNMAYRQFGIVDVLGRAAAFSGERTGAVSASRQDHVPGTGLFVTVQGNLLAGDEVVGAAVDAFKGASGSLTDRVMAAMEAADARGGDKRCTCETEPRPNAPCAARSAHVAYILRADPTDKPGDGVNDGHYAMYVEVTNDDITPAEDANPIKTLRRRYEAWKKVHSR